MHRESVEDRSGERGVTEVAAPVAQRDVRRDGRRDLAVPAIDEVVEGVSCSRLVAALLDLPETDVVDDEKLRARPALEPSRIRAVGEAGVEVVEEVDAPHIAHTDPLLTRTHGEGLEDVALAGAALAGDHEVVVATHEVETRELEHERLVEGRLEVPVEALEDFALDESARLDASRDALLELESDLGPEDMLEERGRAGALARGPLEPLVELGERAGQSEELEVSSESLEDEALVVLLLVSALAASLRHAVVSSVRDRDAEEIGRRSYSVRSRGSVRA